MNVEHHGSRCVGIIGHMNLSIGKLPDKPCLDSAEKQLSRLGFFSGPFNIVQNPFKLGSAEICVKKQTGLFSYHVPVSCRSQFIAVLRCPSALPYYCIVHRNSGLLVPYNRSFTLVGNSYSLDVLVGAVDFQQSLLRHTHLR